MSLVHNCLKYLDSFGVPYTHRTERLPDTAEEIVTAKTVVCEGDDRYLLVVVPAAWYVDIGQVSMTIGAKKVRIATESEITTLFASSEADWIPPLGGLVGLPVCLDRQLANEEFIAFHAGSPHDLIHMKTADLRQIAQTTIGTFGCCDYQSEFRKRLLVLRKAAGA